MGGGSFHQINQSHTALLQMVSLNKEQDLLRYKLKVTLVDLSFKSGGASGTTIATYLFGTEGLDIIFQETVFCLVFIQQLVVLVA